MDGNIVKERMKRIKQKSKEIQIKKAKELSGSRLNVMIESEKKAKADNYMGVVIKGGDDLKPGDILNVTVEKDDDYNLIANI